MAPYQSVRRYSAVDEPLLCVLRMMLASYNGTSKSSPASIDRIQSCSGVELRKLLQKRNEGCEAEGFEAEMGRSNTLSVSL